MNMAPDFIPSCAICGVRSNPECPHEGQRLKMALEQAEERWDGFNSTREWVLNKARMEVLQTFGHLKQMRVDAHNSYLQRLPCFTIYQRHQGNPPLHPSQIQQLQMQITQANEIFKQGIDEDWRNSCLRYPDVLDYYFNLVTVNRPSESDPRLRDPRFGQRRLKAHRGSPEHGRR